MISVLIINHKREKYVYGAILSVLKQKIPESEYEIIVVSNIKLDEKFTNYGNNLKFIYSEDETYGGKLAAGFKISKGEIISPLEDDDQFHEDKLFRIKEVFSDESLIYYHNGKINFSDYIPAVNPDSDSHSIVVENTESESRFKELFEHEDASFFPSCMRI